MTARLDAIGSDGPEAAVSRAAPGDDPLTTFQPELQEIGKVSGDTAALRTDAIPSQAPSVPLATPSVNDGKPHTAGVVSRITRVWRKLIIARDFEKTVDNRLAALRGLDQEVRDRAWRLECLNREIIVGAAHADEILRAIGSFERPLADLREQKQDLRAIETTVAAFEKRAQTVSTSLGRHVADLESREAAVVDAVEQLGRRAAGTIDDLEGRVGDCEARAHIAEQTITRLEEGLPAVGQSDRDLTRIELAVPQIARQLEDLNASAEQQSRVLAVHEQQVRQTLDESQKTADVVSELVAQLEQKIAVLQTQLRNMAETTQHEATKLVDLQKRAERYQVGELEQRTTSETHGASAVLAGLEARMAEIERTHRELHVTDRHVEQLEQRAAAAAGEVGHATRAMNELQREIADCHQHIERLTTAAQGEAERLNELRRHAGYHGADRASSRSLTFGGASLALSAVIVLLVSIVWRISPVENQRPENTLAPALTVTPPMPLAADIRHDRPDTTRPAPTVPAVPVPRAVVSETPVATRGVPAAAVREQSVRTGAKPQFIGTLLIESDPAGAAAFINQEPVGDTPVLLKDLRAGSYVVRLEHEGYQRWSSAATVSAVRQERVKAKLERDRSR